MFLIASPPISHAISPQYQYIISTMTRYLSAALAILLSATTTVSAFSINSHHRQSVFRSTSTTTYATEDTDFDAPIPANPMSGTAVLGK